MINHHKAVVRQGMLTGIACLVALFLSGCSSAGSSSRIVSTDSDSAATEELDSLQAEHDITLDAQLWADSVMATMTLEEMAGQLIMPAVYADDSPASMRLLREYVADSHVGGVVLLKGSVRGAGAIADTLRRMLAVPPLIAMDAEWGLAMRLEHTPEFPRNGRIAPDAEETLLFDYGNEMARECRQLGINMVLGPVLDVTSDGARHSGIGSRSFGSDPERVAKLGVAYAKGLESGGVISVAKHFPGHGSADADSHKRLPSVAKTRDALERSDLVPFREYVANGLSAVMTGHLSVPALDESGVPVTVSEKILSGFLRGEMGFRGLIVTDAINMAGAAGYTAADAIRAGADIVLAPAETQKELGCILQAVKDGSLPPDALRERVGRVLFFKYMSARFADGSGDIGDTVEAERLIKLLR